MRGHSLWSYSPYRPPLFEVGEIYICRVAPSIDTIHIEWLYAGCEEYEVYCRVRSEGEFALCGVTRGNEFDIVGLSDETSLINCSLSLFLNLSNIFKLFHGYR